MKRKKQSFTKFVFVRVEEAHCPECDSTHIVADKTLRRESDNSQGRYSVCKACEERFIVVTQYCNSNFWNDETDVG